MWNTLENIHKNRLKDANGRKTRPIKNESKTKMFSVPGDAQESAS